MAIIDFSDINAFANNTNLAKKAKIVDEALSNNNDFIPSYEILGVDIENQSLDDAEFRKVIKGMRDYLSAHGGRLEEMPTPGNMKYRSYRYGFGYYGQKTLNRDPFFFHRQVKRKIDGAEALSKLKDALAFMPSAWVEAYLGETAILVQNEFEHSNGRNIISSETNLLLTGTQYLTELYSAITEKKAIHILYNSGYTREEHVIFHPQYLKEYNGRWFVCGRSIRDDGKQNDKVLLALDRIIDTDEVVELIDYEGDDDINYEDYFSDIIGVTHSDKWPEIVEVKIKVSNPKVFNLIKTKKLHSSQIENDADSIITLKLRPNVELKTKLLSFGADVEVISPPELRLEFEQEAHAMRQLYRQPFDVPSPDTGL